MYTRQVHNGDCLTILRDYPDDYFNLIVCSPPYADRRQKQYGGTAPDKYCDWFLPRAAEFLRVLRSDGSFVMNIKEGCANGERLTYVYELVLALRKIGWRWVDDIPWIKSTSMPGFWRNRLRDGWEHCYHFAKSNKFAMYQDQVKVPAKQSTIDRVQNLGAADLVRHESGTGSGLGRNHAHWVGKTEVLPPNYLTLSPVTRDCGHPAAFPEGLPEFFIKLLTKENDIVLDPFAGSGTVGRVCERLRRNNVGIEICAEYCKLAATGKEA